MTKTLSATFAWLTANWNRTGWLYVAASFLLFLIFKNTGSPWLLDLLSDVAMGAAAFCWGAGYVQSQYEHEN